MTISVKITGVDQVERELAALPLKSQAAIDAFAQAIYDSAQAGADKHTKTGALARSLYLRPYGKTGWEIGHDLQHAPHALFVHWGTKPHVIRPKKRGALRYVGKDGKFWFWFGPRSQAGRVSAMEWLKRAGYPTGPGGVHAVFKWPNHPGYKGDPWLTNAANDAIRDFDAIVRRAFNA